MKTILSALYRAICHFALAFSGIILFFWAFMRTSGYINYDRLSIFATFALIFGISSFIFSIPKLSILLKTAIHFVINTIGFLSTFVAIDGVTQARAFIVGVTFVIIYFAIYFISILLKKLANPKKKADVVEKEETSTEETHK